MRSRIKGWIESALCTPKPAPAESGPRRKTRWPRDPKLLMTALACCLPLGTAQVKAEDAVPWRVVDVHVHASASGGDWQENRLNDYSGSGSWACDRTDQADGGNWASPSGLQGYFAANVIHAYECCYCEYVYDRWGQIYDCQTVECRTFSVGAGASVFVGSDSVWIHAGSCMEYQYCGSSSGFTVMFDRPMRMVWGGCCSGSDCCYDDGCPIDGSVCGGGQAEFPGAGVYAWTDYYGYTHVYQYFESYTFSFGAGAGSYSFADNIRFERMYPADVLPDGQVNGLDLAAILSKWGGSYDPQRTPEDVNLDGQVSAEDLAAVLFAWGTPG